MSVSRAPARHARAYPSPPILAEALLRRYSRVSPPVARIVALALITTGAPELRWNATAPVTAPSIETRSTTHRSPALRIPPLRLTTVRNVFDTAGPVLR